MSALARLAVLTGILTLASGCAPSNDLYRWDSYEDCVRETCRDPGAGKAPDHIRKLSSEIEQARSEGKRVAPGMHAQLGYLYYLTGNFESAALEFAAEREAYPESAVFIDGLLRRMKAKGAS